MAYIQYNPNPCGRNVGDCSVRAISKALGVDWETAYIRIMTNGYSMCDMPSSDAVWGALLRKNGFYREAIPNTCPDCFSVTDFCKENPEGIYVLGTGGHVVTVINGDYYDAWDSGNEIPQYVWYLPKKN